MELNDEIAEGQMPQALLDYLGRAPDSGQLLESVRGVDEAVAEFENAAGEVAIGMNMDVARRFEKPGVLAEQSLEQQLQLAAGCLADMESVHDIVRRAEERRGGEECRFRGAPYH